MNISTTKAAELSGLNRDAIYKMIQKKTIPHLIETAFGRRSYRIPLDAFCLWIEKELARLERKAVKLRASHKAIKEVLNNG